MAYSNQGIAVAGCGYWGKNLVRNFAELGVLRAVCDENIETLQAFQKQYGVDGFTQYHQLLDRSDIGAVVIATPAETHADLVKQALGAEKDVFVEKPLALTLKDAFEIRSIATKKIIGCLWWDICWSIIQLWLPSVICCKKATLVRFNISIPIALVQVRCGRRRMFCGALLPMIFVQF
jgi:hypothetical protein